MSYFGHEHTKEILNDERILEPPRVLENRRRRAVGSLDHRRADRPGRDVELTQSGLCFSRPDARACHGIHDRRPCDHSNSRPIRRREPRTDQCGQQLSRLQSLSRNAHDRQVAPLERRSKQLQQPQRPSRIRTQGIGSMLVGCSQRSRLQPRLHWKMAS